MNKNKSKLYAKALAEVLTGPAFANLPAGRQGLSAGEERQIIENFMRLLVLAGQEKKAKQILEMAEDLVLAKQGKKKIVFETARKMTPNQAKELENFSGKGDIVKEKVSPELVAGIKIIINGSRQFDNSMQSKLQKIF